MARGLKSPCLAPFPFKILLIYQASTLDRRPTPSSPGREEEKGKNLHLLSREKGQLCLLKVAHSHKGMSSLGMMLSLALVYQADASTKLIHQLLAQQLARLVTSFTAQEEVTSLACTKAHTKAHFYLSHYVFLQVSFPTFHANISTRAY